jgi:hypothetical protein
MCCYEKQGALIVCKLLSQSPRVHCSNNTAPRVNQSSWWPAHRKSLFANRNVDHRTTIVTKYVIRSHQRNYVGTVTRKADFEIGLKP